MNKTVRAVTTIVSFIIVVALTTFGARALDTMLTARMAELKSGVIDSLEAMLGREVDLLNRRALEKSKTHARAAAILAQAEPLYVES